MNGTRSIKMLGLALVLSLATLLAPAAAIAQDSADLQVQNASTVMTGDATPEASPAATPVEGAMLTGYFVGDPDAPVTLQIYSDYQCPFCRIFYADIEPQIIEKYVVTGQVRLELLDMTVVGIPSLDELDDDSLESMQAAEAVMCAAEQDAFMAYRDTLFTIWMTPNSGAFSNGNLVGYADELGLDTDQFSECLESGKYEEAVIAFVHQAIDQGVEGTPTLSIDGGEPFFVPENGFAGISEMLDEALAS